MLISQIQVIFVGKVFEGGASLYKSLHTATENFMALFYM